MEVVGGLEAVHPAAVGWMSEEKDPSHQRQGGLGAMLPAIWVGNHSSSTTVTGQHSTFIFKLDMEAFFPR